MRTAWLGIAQPLWEKIKSRILLAFRNLILSSGWRDHYETGCQDIWFVAPFHVFGQCATCIERLFGLADHYLRIGRSIGPELYIRTTLAQIAAAVVFLVT